MANRHEVREKIIFSIYQHLLLHKDLNTCFNDNFEQMDEFVQIIRLDLLKNENSYIETITPYLNKWSFDRLNLVEQAILLESYSEIINKLNDHAVVIDEAVILCKQYCDEESYKYINGVLDNLCKNLQ